MHYLTPSHPHRATRTVTLLPSWTTLLLTLSYKHQICSQLHPYPAQHTRCTHSTLTHMCKHTCTHMHAHARTCTHTHPCTRTHNNTPTHTHPHTTLPTHDTNTPNTQLEARTTNLRRIISSVSWKRLAHLFCGHLGSRLEQSPRKVGGTVVHSVAAVCERLTRHSMPCGW